MRIWGNYVLAGQRLEGIDVEIRVQHAPLGVAPVSQPRFHRAANNLIADAERTAIRLRDAQRRSAFIGVVAGHSPAAKCSIREFAGHCRSLELHRRRIGKNQPRYMRCIIPGDGAIETAVVHITGGAVHVGHQLGERIGEQQAQSVAEALLDVSLETVVVRNSAPLRLV